MQLIHARFKGYIGKKNWGFAKQDVSNYNARQLASLLERLDPVTWRILKKAKRSNQYQGNANAHNRYIGTLAAQVVLVGGEMVGLFSRR